MSWIDGVKSFLSEKFWQPIVDETVFYNPFNTAVYSTLFAVMAAYVGYPVLQKMEVVLNKNFFIGIAPFVFLGGSIRSLKDINAFNSILLETPFIYGLMFGIITGSLYLSKKLSERTDYRYHEVLFSLGVILLAGSLSFYRLNNLTGLVLIVSLMTGITVLGYIILRIISSELLTPEFYLPVFAHYFDAGVTGIALMFPGTAEKHVLARFFIEYLGPVPGMILMKSLIIPPATYYIMKNVDGQEKLYYLFLICLLGFAIATRNILSFLTLT